MEFNHYSVMLEETIEELKIKPEGLYVDGTLGGGGHSSRIAGKLTTGHLYGIDQDDAAIKAAGERLAEYGDKVRIIAMPKLFCRRRAWRRWMELCWIWEYPLTS